MLKQLTATLQQDEGWYIAFCPEIPEANGQGRTKADALEDLSQAVAFLLQCEWEEALGVVPGKIKKAKGTLHEARRSDPTPKTSRLPVARRGQVPLKVV